MLMAFARSRAGARAYMIPAIVIIATPSWKRSPQRR